MSSHATRQGILVHSRLAEFAELLWTDPGSGKNHLARHSERGKKTRRAKEEVGRQHQGMDRPGVWQVPEGMENREKWRKLVAKSSVVPQRPSRLRD